MKGPVSHLASAFGPPFVQLVCVLGEYSDTHTRHLNNYGVPQGSIAWPSSIRPYCVYYAQPFTNMIRRIQIGYHVYADDTQLDYTKLAACITNNLEPMYAQLGVGGGSCHTQDTRASKSPSPHLKVSFSLVRKGSGRTEVLIDDPATTTTQ